MNNTQCEMQYFLYNKFCGMTYFRVYELFHFSLNVLISQSEETSNNTNNLGSILCEPFASQTENINNVFERYKNVLAGARENEFRRYKRLFSINCFNKNTNRPC